MTTARRRSATSLHPGEPGSHTWYGRGCGCPECLEAHRLAQATWAASQPGLRTRAAGDSAALTCACGGMLAEDDDGRVFCLSCESDHQPQAYPWRATR